MWKVIATAVGKLLWSQRGRLKPHASDEELRAVARVVWAQHSLAHDVPFSVAQGWARERLDEMGYKLDDETDERLTDILDNERARLRMPAQLDELTQVTGSMAESFKESERAGRAAVTSWADNGDDDDKEKE